MTDNNALKNILILPRWYPNKTDIQLGIFIQRQLVLMQNDFNFNVVYVQAITNASKDFEIVSTVTSKTLTEHIIYFKSATGIFKKISNLKRYKKAQKLGIALINKPIDLCHIHVPYRSAMPALHLLKTKKTPFLITEHWSGHLNGLYQQKNSFDKYLYRRIVKKAAKISTVSKALQKAFKQNTGFNSEVIPNYIEHDYLQKKEPSQQINILSVSDFDDKTKNITGLLTAFKAASLKNNNIKLTLIGGGPDETLIQNKITELQIPKNQLELTGRQPHQQVLKAMANCDFYICNSRYETFGMTVAEALICGKPVISTRCGGPEEFLNIENSLLIDPNKNQETDNWKILFEALQKMTTTYKNYNSKKISEAINTQFGKNAIQQKWLNFYSNNTKS